MAEENTASPPPESGVELFKQCKSCGETKPARCFERTGHTLSGAPLYRGTCVVCRNLDQRQRLNDARSSIESYASVLVWRCRDRARKRGVREVPLTAGWIVGQWDRQQGKCYYSGASMELVSGPRLVTVERLDVTRGYECDNCVLACLCVNMMRGSVPLGEFAWWCEQVAKNCPLAAESPRENSV